MTAKTKQKPQNKKKQITKKGLVHKSLPLCESILTPLPMLISQGYDVTKALTQCSVLNFPKL